MPCLGSRGVIQSEEEPMNIIASRSLLTLAFGTMLLFGGCATKESVEAAQSSADAAKASAAQAMTAAQSAQAAAQAAAQKADQAEMDAQAASSMSREVMASRASQGTKSSH